MRIAKDQPSQPFQAPPARTGSLQCLFLNTYHPAFLEAHYRGDSALAGRTYAEQLASLQAAGFGDSDFYSHGLAQAGWGAGEIIVNAPVLQAAWCRENGFRGAELEIARAQVAALKPDVVYVQDLNCFPPAFLASLRPHTRLLAGQIATPMKPGLDLRPYDVIFTSFPHFAERFRKAGLAAFYQPLAFEPRLLERLKGIARDLPCSFVGGISGLHLSSYGLLDLLARETPMEFWGYGRETLAKGSPVLARHRGEAWGLDMFAVFARSAITVNRHGEVAENHANNMRLFEATGCGCLLVTDYKDNLPDLFEIGREVAAFRTPEECAALVKYYLRHPEEAAGIAAEGQRRTLREHTYGNRMRRTAEVLERQLRYRSLRFERPDVSRVSVGKTDIAPAQVTRELVEAWKAPSLAVSQRNLVQGELKDLYAGKVVPAYRILADLIPADLASGAELLEIGCSSGYYYEVLDYLLPKPVRYVGLDYSRAMIRMAKEFYPRPPFLVADAGALPFYAGAFAVAVSSGVLLHLPDFRRHIGEVARVARDYAIAHRVPVSRKGPTRHLRKQGYGVDMVELRFNEAELLSEFGKRGLDLVRAVEYETRPSEDAYELSYLFRKRPGTGPGKGRG